MVLLQFLRSRHPRVRMERCAPRPEAGAGRRPGNRLLGANENRLGDDCRNPWNPERTSGGSSGGAAAVTAAGLCALATGGDGGGSVRVPASFCGIYSIKPTQGQFAAIEPQRPRLHRRPRSLLPARRQHLAACSGRRLEYPSPSKRVETCPRVYRRGRGLNPGDTSLQAEDAAQTPGPSAATLRVDVRRAIAVRRPEFVTHVASSQWTHFDVLV